MTDFDKVKDSGERRQFESGAVRDRQKGKGRYDLITPLAIRRIAKHYENGAIKYKDRNWEKGMPISVYVDSGIRHAFNYLEGMRDEDHLAAACWNFMAVIHFEEMIERGLMPKELNDLPSYIKDNKPYHCGKKNCNCLDSEKINAEAAEFVNETMKEIDSETMNNELDKIINT